MLPSSLNTPAETALLSSEELNVVTSAAHLVGVSENESERGGEEDDDDSDNDIHFSIFNATYNADQKKSHTNYIELSIQSQINKRGL